MTIRVSFGILSLAIFGMCMANYWVEYTPTWKDYQIKYYVQFAEKIDDPAQAAEVRNTRPQFAQIYNAELGVVDRCTICHLGMENPQMDGAPNPHKVHPGDLLTSHPYQQVGCTFCHEGQGLATTLDDAHGHVRHWERPLLTGDFVQATCAKCHNEQEVPQAPVLSRGKRLLRERGCVGCHHLGDQADPEHVGPRLTAIGSKVSRKWLNKWLMNPKDYLSNGNMPVFHIRPNAANALAAYLIMFKDESIDKMPDREGDYDAGALIYRKSQCTVCHVTRTDYEGKPVGGTIGPDLRKIGNKVNKNWLRTFLKNPHAFYPNTKMPRFHFDDREVLDLAQYMMEEWVDYDLLDAEEAEPELSPDSPELVEQGRMLLGESGCAGCHELTGERFESSAPDLTFVGSKRVHELDFGNVSIRHTLPDFFYAKLKSPRSLHSDFQLPIGKDPAVAIWTNLQPMASYSKSATLPGGSESERLAWILRKVQEQTAPLSGGGPPGDRSGEPEAETPDDQEQDTTPEATVSLPGRQEAVDPSLALPAGSPHEQALWLVRILNDAGVLNPLRMPNFVLDSTDAEALTIALMSHSTVRVASKRFEVPPKQKVVFNPRDEFGRLERRYRCRSCHGIRGSGTILASDLTFEGSRANRDWLYNFLKQPYSMRRTLTIAMPLFDFPDEDARFMADYLSHVFVDTQLGARWKELAGAADAEHGKVLFDAKGCIACHQLHGKGGDVGPNFTTQVPEFPHGTWVGDKLRGEWIFRWLKEPHSLVPDALEPKLGLSDAEAADLTAYLLSLKNPEFQTQTQGSDTDSQTAE